MVKISYFNNVKDNNKMHDVDLIKFLTTDYFKEIVERIRNGESELKKTLPAITPHALFQEKRGVNEPYTPSGILFVDVDGKENEHSAKEIKNFFKRLNETVAVRYSNSGIGVHAFLNIGDNDLEASYKTIKNLMDRVGIVIDKCKDLSRLCFASYDADVYLNTEATKLNILHEDVINPKIELKEFNYDGDDPQADFYKYCKHFNGDFRDGNRNHFIFHKACIGRDKFGLSQNQVESTLLAWICKGFTRSEITAAVSSAFKS